MMISVRVRLGDNRKGNLVKSFTGAFCHHILEVYPYPKIIEVV